MDYLSRLEEEIELAKKHGASEISGLLYAKHLYLQGGKDLTAGEKFLFFCYEVGKKIDALPLADKTSFKIALYSGEQNAGTALLRFCINCHEAFDGRDPEYYYEVPALKEVVDEFNENPRIFGPFNTVSRIVCNAMKMAGIEIEPISL